jgi:hypothetical protein
MRRDTVKYQKALYLNYYFMLLYYNDIAKDLPKAIEMTDKMIMLYPEGSDEHRFAKQTGEALRAALNRRTGNGTGTGTPPRTGNTTNGNTQKPGNNTSTSTKVGSGNK